MKYGTLGKSELKVSRLGLGCWAFAGGSVWGSQDEKASIDTIRAALDAGITLFDTSEMYGDGKSEEVVGKALKGCRDKAVIASKVASPNLSQDKVMQACEQSLRRLQTDYLDLYQIHWPNRDVAIEETARALKELVKQGKVRTIGVSNFGVMDMEGILACTSLASNQLPYSLLWRVIEDTILPKCREQDVGVIPYSPLSQGLLTGKYRTADEVPPGLAITRFYSCKRTGTRHGEPGMEAETFAAVDAIRSICREIGEPMGNVATAWLLQQPGVASVLIGARSPQQLYENSKAAELTLSDAVCQALTQATEALKRKVGDNPDMWEGRAKSRYR